MKKLKKTDVIQASISIKNKLKERLKELNLSYRLIILDAKKHNISITKSSLSKYLNYDSPVEGCLTQTNIIWLCFRYCIDIRVKSELKEYNEKRALEKLKLFFE